MTVPNSADDTTSFSFTIEGQSRRLCPTPSATPAVRQAAIAAFASATVERERLFAEHVLAGGGRRFDLRAVARVRRRQHHGVDRCVGEHVFVRGADA